MGRPATLPARFYGLRTFYIRRRLKDRRPNALNTDLAESLLKALRFQKLPVISAPAGCWLERFGFALRVVILTVLWHFKRCLC